MALNALKCRLNHLASLALKGLTKTMHRRKLFFYRKISLSKNAILRTLMCLHDIFSDYMFLCSKYGVKPTSIRDSIKDAVFMISLAAYL